MSDLGTMSDLQKVSNSGNCFSVGLWPRGGKAKWFLLVTHATQCFLVSYSKYQMQRLIAAIDMGQGGAQSIEDGAALGELFTDVSSVNEVPSKLELFQSIRRDRCSAIQYLSNAGQDEAKKVESQVRPYVKVGAVPCTS